MNEVTGERRIASVLVSDIVDSTGIGERLGPERSKFLFDEVARLQAEQVRRFGGTVAQHTGDGVLALFGTPVAHGDDAERAVRAAMAIHDALAQYGLEVRAAYDIELSARVAINTGPVVVPASDAAPDVLYNALGDTVNVAARLQAHAAPDGTVVGPLTARQVDAQFELESLGELELKGKTGRIHAFAVTGERDVDQYIAPTAIVGRDAELDLLEQVFDGLVDGRGAIVVVTGEPGIGKSRLVAEMRHRRGADVRFLGGHAVSYAETLPYWPLRDLLRAWLGVGASAPEARVRLELKAALASSAVAEADDIYPFLANLLALELESDAAERIRAFSRDSVQRQTVDAFGVLVTRLAKEQPTCVVLDDLHWADEATLELIIELLSLVEEEAVTLMLLYRSEREHASWHLGAEARRRFPHRFREIELTPLDLDASRLLATGTAGAAIPDEVSHLLTERSGGNPFFFEEALRDLLERGALRRENGSFELATGIEAVEVPAVVHEALQARLDRLKPATRDLLGVAAVIGRSFASPLLERVRPEEQLRPALTELQRLELVVEERRRPAPEYRFRHGLVQEAAYGRLLETERRRIHLEVGQALEELHADSLTEAYGLLAHHFARADEPRRAAEYLLRAGDAARSLNANDEALTHYREALRFLDRQGDEERARKTLLKIALTHHLAFDFGEAAAAFAEAFARREPVGTQLEASERLETASAHPEAFVPGLGYTVAAWLHINQLFRGLLAVDRELDVVPDVAESFELSDDGRLYRFRLRSNERWTDGEPVTADDFAFAWSRMRAEGVWSAFALDDVDAVAAVDRDVLEVRLRVARNYFPYVLAEPPSFPWPRHVVERLGTDWSRPSNLIGNGPFEIAAYDQQHLVLRRAATWTRACGNVGEVGVAFAGTSAPEMWRRGELDLTDPWDRAFSDDEYTVVESAPATGTWYVGFRPVTPFDDVRVRRAFAHALDRDRLADKVGQAAHPARRGGLIPPGMPAHSHRIGLEHDLDLAGRLLGEAGFPNGHGLPEVELLAGPARSGGGSVGSVHDVAEQWRRLGVQVRVESIPALSDYDRVLRERGHAFMWGWQADYPDPDGMIRTFAQTIPYIQQDDIVLALLEAARNSTDQSDRARLYEQAERRWIMDLAAFVPYAYLETRVLRRPHVDGYWVNSIGLSPFDQLVLSRQRP